MPLRLAGQPLERPRQGDHSDNQALYASLRPGMDKAEATPGRDHSPSQHPQRPESQLLGSVHFDWRCVAFWKVRSVPLAISIPQSLRTSPSSGQATLSSLPATQGQRSKDREDRAGTSGSGDQACRVSELLSVAN